MSTTTTTTGKHQKVNLLIAKYARVSPDPLLEKAAMCNRTGCNGAECAHHPGILTRTPQLQGDIGGVPAVIDNAHGAARRALQNNM